jgi:hypothetical protein
MEWKSIPEFPNYSVSLFGEVRNEETDRVMTILQNQSGLAQVGMTKGGVQYRRGVALLVAKAFLDPPSPPTFDTPINLDGDRLNNHYENLMWRPRWFAIMYHQQFYNDKRGFKKPVRELSSGNVYPTSWDAAIEFGLLDREIMIATLNRTYVWPTYQRFQLIE